MNKFKLGEEVEYCGKRVIVEAQVRIVIGYFYLVKTIPYWIREDHLSGIGKVEKVKLI